MKPTLKPGIEHELRFVVPESKTVPNLYLESEGFGATPEVFATGFLVGRVAPPERRAKVLSACHVIIHLCGSVPVVGTG